MPLRLLDERDLAEIKSGISANAIKGNLSGQIVRADDVSPYEHEMAVKVKSKNLIGPFKSAHELIRDGVTISVEENGQTITLNGTCGTTAGGRNSFNEVASHILLEKGKTYTLSSEKVSGITEGTYSIYINSYDGYEAIASVSNTVESRTKTFTPEKTMECFVGVNIAVNTTYEDVVIRFQLEEGKTATPYTPYVDPSTVTVRRCKKNMIPFPYPNLYTSNSGELSVEMKGDGGVLLNGTVTKETFVNLCRIYFGENTISPTTRYGLVSNKDENSQIYCSYDKKNFLTFINVPAGTVCDNFVFYPQVEVGESSTEFEIGTEHEIYTTASDGVVEEVTSLSPTITLLTDKDGAIVECEYIKDTSKVIEKLTNAIIVLGGTL